MRVLLLLLLVFFTLLSTTPACVTPTAVPQDDLRLAEEEVVTIAILQILEEQGYTVVSGTGEGKRFTTSWIPNRDNPSRLNSATVSLQQSGLGIALRTRVLVAVPDRSELGTQPEGKATAPLEIDGQTWFLDHSLRALAAREESRLGHLIEDRWLELRVENRKKPARNVTN